MMKIVKDRIRNNNNNKAIMKNKKTTDKFN